MSFLLQFSFYFYVLRAIGFGILLRVILATKQRCLAAQ